MIEAIDTQLQTIFERELAGDIISLDDPDYPQIYAVIRKAIRLTSELNAMPIDDNEQVNRVFSELINKPVDDTFFLIPPFYTDFGHNIQIGRNVFVNHACTFMDRGGITLEDNVLIGPKVNLITSNHPTEPGTKEGREAWGMATATYPVHNGQGNARVRLYADGHAVVQVGATDLGTGTYTIITQVAADVLGIAPDKVRFELGDSALPTTIISGGSMGAGTFSSSVYAAAQDLWQKFIKVAVMDAKSPLYRAKPTDVEVVKGRLQLKASPTKGEEFAAVMQRGGLSDLEGFGQGRYGAGYESAQASATANDKSDDAGRDDPGQHAMHSFGAHFCEVRVDPELGTVRITKWVSVVAGGRILNPKKARSQTIGGLLWALGRR